MTVSTGDVLKVTLEWTLPSGTICQNVFHVKANLLAGQADLVVVNEIEDWVEQAYANLSSYFVDSIVQNLCLVDEVAWDGAKWAIVRNVGTFTPTIAFLSALPDFPDPVAPFVVFGTERPKSKGRKFLFGFEEGAAAGSYLLPAVVTSLVNYAADALTSIVIAPLNTLVPGVPREAVDVFLEFAYAVVTNVMGTQRRRRPGVGI